MPASVCSRIARKKNFQLFQLVQPLKMVHFVVGVLGEGEQAASKKPALRAGFAAQR